MPDKEAKEALKTVAAFLLGEGTLDGRWLSDPPPTYIAGRPATYWWRKHLRKAVDDVLKSEEQ